MTTLTASDLAGLRIREARKLRGWTVRNLADQCAEAGAPHITATVITNLETRRRSTREITVDELLAIAYVLGVAPIQLISPLNDGEHLEVVPGVSKDALEAPGWVADDASVLGPVRYARDARAEYTERILRHLPHQSNSPLTLIRQIREVVARIMGIQAELANKDWCEQHPGLVRYNKRALPILGARLFHLIGWMAALGYAPPGVPDVMEILREHGVPATLAEWREQADGDEDDETQ